MAVRDVVHGAMRRIGILDIGEEADADATAIALAAYNAMHREAALAGWIATAWTDQGLNDATALGAAYDEAAKAAVAVRIAPDFARPVDRRLALDGNLWLAQLAAAAPIKATFEAGFHYQEADEELTQTI